MDQRIAAGVTGKRKPRDGPERRATINYWRMEVIGKKVIIRTYSAGVHYGTLAVRDGKEVVLNDSRRIWYWSGAASLSQLAVEGTRNPGSCKFCVPVASILLTEAIEIIPVTDCSAASIEGVAPWKV
jgi:hypothetical protein